MPHFQESVVEHVVEIRVLEQVVIQEIAEVQVQVVERIQEHIA